MRIDKNKLGYIYQNCLSLSARRINRIVSKISDNHLRPLGLKGSQTNILFLIAYADAVYPKTISNILHLEASTVSRNVKIMLDNGWVEIIPDEDQRTAPLQLTSEGKKLVKKAMKAWDKAQHEISDLLGPEAVKCINQLDGKLNQT